MEVVFHETAFQDVPLAPEAVEFTAAYHGRNITCRIGCEALARFGNPRARPGEALNTREARWARFEANRAQVHDLAARLIRTGSYEPDGSIVIEASDVPRRSPPGQP
jgi:hypothetical protein